MTRSLEPRHFSALGGTRTPNLLIRSQMLYPLSYKREFETNESLRCVEGSSLAERQSALNC